MPEDYKKYTMGYEKHGRKDEFNRKKTFTLEEKNGNLDFLRKATSYTLTISQRTIPVAGFVHEADVMKKYMPTPQDP